MIPKVETGFRKKIMCKKSQSGTKAASGEGTA